MEPEPIIDVIVPDFAGESIDLTVLNDAALAVLRAAVLAEQERRYLVATAEARAADLASQYAQAIGREDGDPWTQPAGAHDAYRAEAIVTHGGKTWESLIPNNVWEPGVSGWREVVAEGYPAWVQPTGSHDAYNTGDRVSFEGANYESLIDDNTWSPSAYPAGWRGIE